MIKFCPDERVIFDVGVPSKLHKPANRRLTRLKTPKSTAGVRVKRMPGFARASFSH
jgi:hypothetical protein